LLGTGQALAGFDAPASWLLPLAATEIEPGIGTRVARALMSQAWTEELLLIRVDPSACHQLQHVARRLRGETWQSPALVARLQELRQVEYEIDRQRPQLLAERRFFLENFRLLPDEVLNDAESRKLRQEFAQLQERQRQFERKQRSYLDAMDRWLQLQQRLERLKEVDTVVVALQWPDGHPTLPGQLGSLRHLGLPAVVPQAATPTWFQAVPNTDASVWTGLFRDTNGDHVMEFAAPPASSGAETTRTRSRQRDDLNFLAWQAHGWTEATEKPVEKAPDSSPAFLRYPPWTRSELLWQELPANLPGMLEPMTVKVTVQWREIHSPDWKRPQDPDHYREPLIPIELIVLRQRDPTGERLPADAFEVVHRTSGLPDRLENEPRYAIYQIASNFVVSQPDRYAIQVIGHSPTTIFPAEAPKFANDERWELYPVIRVEAQGAARGHGKVVFQNHE
jgi:hypothetical protein